MNIFRTLASGGVPASTLQSSAVMRCAVAAAASALVWLATLWAML
jgi:hypothetical protein